MKNAKRTERFGRGIEEGIFAVRSMHSESRC
jgi:hypothetical protein